MAFFAYSRCFHLILLIAALAVYLTYYTFMYYWKCPKYTSDLPRIDEWYFPAVLLVFFFFWLLRGLAAFASLFPYFHYTTLLLELFVNIAALGYTVYTQVLYTGATFTEVDEFALFVYGLGAVMIVLYVLLILMYGPLYLSINFQFRKSINYLSFVNILYV